VHPDDQGDPGRDEVTAAAPGQEGGAEAGQRDLDPTTIPKVRLVSASNAVGSVQCRQVRTPPATAVSRDRIDPAASQRRQAGGGWSWAQPNQADAKKPKTAAVATA
jgi:hypothetical protein